MSRSNSSTAISWRSSASDICADCSSASGIVRLTLVPPQACNTPVIPPANEFKLRSLGEKQEKFLGIDLSPDGHLTQRGLSAGLHIGYAGLTGGRDGDPVVFESPGFLAPRTGGEIDAPVQQVKAPGLSARLIAPKCAVRSAVLWTNREPNNTKAKSTGAAR